MRVRSLGIGILFLAIGCADDPESPQGEEPNTEITRVFSQHATGDPALADPDIAPGDTIADSSRVTFQWSAQGDDITGFYWEIAGQDFASDTALASDPDTHEATVQWLVSDAPVIEPPPPEGSRLIVGAITADGRREATPDTVPFFVNYAPTAEITSPSDGMITLSDSTLWIGWEGADRDGPASRIVYHVRLVPEGGFATSRNVADGGSTSFVRVHSGTYTISVMASDHGAVGPARSGVPDSIRVELTVP